MENMDKGLTVPKWVLINRPKIHQMLQNLSAKIVCSSPKVWDFDEKRLLWVSVVRDLLGQLLVVDALPGTTEGQEIWGGVPGYSVLKSGGFRLHFLEIKMQQREKK